MFSSNSAVDPQAAPWLDFSLREITGRWVSRQGAPPVRIYRNDARKNGCLWLELTYDHPRAVYARPVKDVFGFRYFDLFGRIGIAYDPERDVLLLCAYGEYVRAEE